MSWPRWRSLFTIPYARLGSPSVGSQQGGVLVKDLFSQWRLTLSGGHQKAGALVGGALCLETPHSLFSVWLKVNGVMLTEIPGTDLRVVHQLSHSKDVQFTPTVATTDVTTSFEATYDLDWKTRLSDFERRTLLALNRYDTAEFGVTWGSELSFHSGAYATTHAITAATKIEVEGEMYTGIPEFHIRVNPQTGLPEPVTYWHRRFTRTTFDVLSTTGPGQPREFPITMGETIARIYLKEYIEGAGFETPVNNIINTGGALEIWFNGGERKMAFTKDKLDKLINDDYRLGIGTATTIPLGYHVIDLMRDRDFANAMRTDAGSGLGSLVLKADVTTQAGAKIRALIESFVPSL